MRIQAISFPHLMHMALFERAINIRVCLNWWHAKMCKKHLLCNGKQSNSVHSYLFYELAEFAELAVGLSFMCKKGNVRLLQNIEHAFLLSQLFFIQFA